MRGITSGISLKTSLAGLLGVCCLMWINRADSQLIVWGDNSFGQTNVPPDATNVIAMAAGDYHCVALRANGTVLAWGANTLGQTNVPSDLTNAVDIAAGSTHSLALRNDGRVTLWGTIYTGATNVSPEASNVVALARGPGAQHALVLRADGTVVDWGNTGYDLTNIPPTARNIVSVAASARSALALRADGTVVAWGDNSLGQTNVPADATNLVAIAAAWNGYAALRADGTVVGWGAIPPPPAPLSNFGFTNVVGLACPFDSRSSAYILAARRDGTLVLYPPLKPLPANATNVVAVAAGSFNGLALVGGGPPIFPERPVNRTVDGGLTAYFRMNAVGAFPISYQWTCDGTNIPGATNVFLAVTNVQPAQAGSVYAVIATNAFGTNSSGPMILNETPSEVFIKPQSLSTVLDAPVTFTANVIGQGPFSYQWQFDGTNLPDATSPTLTLTNAQLADTGTYSVVVSNEFGLTTNFVELAVSPTIVTNTPQSQAIFPNGTVQLRLGVQAVIPVTYRWQFNGEDLYNETGSSLTLTNILYRQGGEYAVIYSDAYETVTNSARVSVVPLAAWGNLDQFSVPLSLTNLIGIACGYSHDLALNSDGTVTGWGDNSLGESTSPPGLSNVVAISAGFQDSLALRNDGTVVAWGNNSDGQCNVPTGLSNVVAVAAGYAHNLALKSDGTVVAWGRNSSAENKVPVGLSNVVAIAAGYDSIALKENGSMVAWGLNNLNETNLPPDLTNVVQIAMGDTSLALTADGFVVGWGDGIWGQGTAPAGLSNVVAIAAGYEHSVALKDDGTVVAWGYPYNGDTNVPVGLTNAISINADNSNNLALVGNGPPRLHALLSNPEWGPNGFSVSLPTRSGHAYRLEYKNSLADPAWTALPLAAGNGGMLTLTDPTASNTQRFYRVQKW